jgi:hypothetical protein
MLPEKGVEGPNGSKTGKGNPKTIRAACSPARVKTLRTVNSEITVCCECVQYFIVIVSGT